MSLPGPRAIRYALGTAGACVSAAAQCSMCRNAVAAQGAADTFDRAILILLIPAVAMFSCVFIFACRYGNSEPVHDSQRGEDEGTVD